MNDSFRLALEKHPQGFLDQAAHLVDRLIEHFHPEFFARVRSFGSDSRRPIFIFGLPRSGTTLIEQILARHSQVTSGS